MTVQIIRGVVIWALAALVAAGLYTARRLGWLGGDTVYASPILPAVLIVATLAIVISGFQSTKAALAERDLQQQPMIRIELTSQLSAFVVMVVLAWLTGSIWSLVVGQLTATAVSVALSHVALPGPGNRLAWDAKSLEELLAFGKWIFASSFVGVFALNADRIVRGGLVSAEILGQFAIAATLVATVQGVFSEALRDVGHADPERNGARGSRSPQGGVLSRARPDRLGAAFRSRFARGDRASHRRPALRPPLFRRRLDAADLGRLAGRARYEATQQLYLALGIPKFNAFLNLARLISVFAAMLLGFRLDGVRGAIWGFALHQAVAAVMTYRFNVGLRLNDFLRELCVLVAVPIGYGVGLGVERIAGR